MQRWWGWRWRRSSQSAEDTVTIALTLTPPPVATTRAVLEGPVPVLRALYDSLFVTQPDGTVEPSLVTEFENNADNTQTTLTLRDDVTFTDGSTLDAELVKANLDRRADPSSRRYGAIAPGQASEITDVTAQDEQTVVITWAAPQTTPENNLVDTAGVIVGADGVADPDSLETTPDGSGAYTVNEGETTQASTTPSTRTTRRGTPTSGRTTPSFST